VPRDYQYRLPQCTSNQPLDDLLFEYMLLWHTKTSKRDENRSNTHVTWCISESSIRKVESLLWWSASMSCFRVVCRMVGLIFAAFYSIYTRKTWLTRWSNWLTLEGELKVIEGDPSGMNPPPYSRFLGVVLFSPIQEVSQRWQHCMTQLSTRFFTYPNNHSYSSTKLQNCNLLLLLSLKWPIKALISSL
jgi:hypothetical protein